MLLRLMVCVGMVGFCIWHGIHATMPTAMVRLLYSACAILLLSGLNPRGLITWPIASLLLLSRGHWFVGWIPLGLVVFNIIGNELAGRHDPNAIRCSNLVLQGFRTINAKCLRHLGNEDESSRCTALIAGAIFVAFALKILEEYDLPNMRKQVARRVKAYYESIIPASLSQEKATRARRLLDMSLSLQQRMPPLGSPALPGFMLGALGGTSGALSKTVGDILEIGQQINTEAATLSSPADMPLSAVE